MDEQRLQAEVVTPLITRIKSFEITSNDDYEELFSYVKENDAAQKEVTAYFYDMKTNAHKAWKSIVAKEKEFLEPLQSSKTIAKRKLATWHAEQLRIQREKEAKLQAEADARAEKERQRLLKRAEKLKTPELKEEAYEAAEQVQAPIVQVMSAPEVKGASYRSTWKAREYMDKDTLIKAAANGNELAASFLQINFQKLNAFAKSTKGSVPVPGVEFYEDKILVVR